MISYVFTNFFLRVQFRLNPSLFFVNEFKKSIVCQQEGVVSEETQHLRARVAELERQLAVCQEQLQVSSNDNTSKDPSHLDCLWTYEN